VSCADQGLTVTVAGSYQGATAHLNTLGVALAAFSKTFRIDCTYSVSQSLEDAAVLEQAWGELARS
jgi:hypothetical protein